MGFLSNLFGNMLDFQGKVDPLGSKLTDETLDGFANLAELGFDGAGDIGNALGWDDLAEGGSHWEGMARKDRRDHARQLSNAASVAAAGYGGGAWGTAAKTLGTAGAGALAGGAVSAGQGGSLKDIFKGAAMGGAGGLAGGYLPDLGGYAGIENPTLKGAFNSGVYGGAKTALQGGNFLQGAAQSAAPGLAGYGWDQLSGAPDVGTMGGTMQDDYGESSTTLGGMMTPAQASADEGRMSIMSTGGGEGPSFSDQVGQILGNVGVNRGNFGDVVAGGMGLYDAYRRNRQAKKLMSAMGGNRGAYEQQLRQNLMRRDAASGRRSDYGGREVALQSSLAQLDARNAPSMMAIDNMQNQSRLGGLSSLFNMGKKTNWFGYGG